MSGVPELVGRFRADVGAAVTRARRAASEAGVRVAAQRAGNRTRGGGAATSGDVRRVATGFRVERGLPLGPVDLPESEESRKQTDTNANAEPPSRFRSAPGPRGRLPRESGDDEDFSQARILS
ncbi:hypothetical protein GCM10022243_05190 [Saccharothrix violaceirubra]|uniref:Pyruvate/2-oxoglutarate dehydrogenase complex dihydrolipoamide acyltransferase (E2) component n=1 Tax=Saccharothrix violaceirubra TaxID=413306 RepID=A0A7W7WTB4_9PSEU|nr:pyruvate/2-oxoglutarate dehydrogenase complex dihydrolipoamide acyltransferase (E2) component [Saccharothrix violaceirubra]